jgi:two-component system, cell cycle response regulator CtrA
MNIITAGLDGPTIEFLRANGLKVDQQDIDGPDELKDWLREASYDAGVIEIERSRLGIYAARPLRMAKIMTPLIGISAGGPNERKWSDHRAMFLENGGDDLLKAPANPRELMASMLAATRRGRGVVLDIVVERSVGGALFRMNMTTGAVTVDGIHIHFTGKERDTLSMLASRAGRICSKESILTYIYSSGGSPDDEPEIKIVDVFICKLRHKLNEAHPGAGKLIETVWAQGYMFQPQLAAAAA